LLLVFNGNGFSILTFQRKPLESSHTPAQRHVNWIRIQLAHYSSAAVLKQQTSREDDVEDTRSKDASPLWRNNNNYTFSRITSSLDTVSPTLAPSVNFTRSYLLQISDEAFYS
jgi:hypothetical protein